MAYTGNQNWPQLFAEFEGSAGLFPGTASPLPWTQMAYRLYGQWSTRRGEQFEIGQQQPGEWSGQLVNKDGMLDPSNTSSLLSPEVLPFKQWRLRAQWPPSANVLTVDQATGGEGTPLSGTVPASLGMGSDYAALTATASGTAFQGAQVFQAAVPSSSAAGSRLWYLAAQSAVAAAPAAVTGAYTYSVYARCATAGASPQVAATLTGYSVTGAATSLTSTSGTSTLTGGASASWTRFSVTLTPGPADATVGFTFSLQLVGTPPAGAFTFQTDAVQVEQAASASAYTVPGKTYPVCLNGIERYPQAWNHSGTYGLVSPIATDAMSILSQQNLLDAWTSEVNALSPAWYFPLDDPSGAVTFNEQAGRLPAANLFVSSYGPGSITPGVAVAAANPGGVFVGPAGPVVTVNNPDTPGNSGTVINLTTSGITGPPAGGFTRMIAVKTTLASVSTVIAMASRGTFDGTYNPSFSWGLLGTQANVSLYAPGGASFGVDSVGVTVNDGNWHLWVFTLSADGKTLTLYVDGIATVGTAASDVHSTGTVCEGIGGQFYPSQGYAPCFFTGDVAHYTQFNSVLTGAQVARLYSAWRSAFSGDTSGARYSRILGYAGYTGPASVDTGVSTSLGPATDIAGKDALTALQDVVDTENGQHFVAADGTLTFYGRNRRYLAATPTVTFGDANPLGAQIPYTSVAFDFDPTRLANSVTVTQVSTGQQFKAKDMASIGLYGTRTLARNNQSSIAAECQDAADYLLSRYKAPTLRVQSLGLDVSSNPALMFPVALSLELGQRVALVRTPPSPAAAITMSAFVDQITHTADDQADWSTRLQISPADTTNYGLFTSLHATLHASASSGANTISVNALPDAATNVLRANLTGGQQLVLDLGLPTQETVTIATGGVPVTSLGYTSATLTLAGSMTQNHANNAAVGEPMPTGAASSTVYDSFGAFDSVRFSY